MPNALANSVGELPLEHYNVAPTTQIALLYLQGDVLHADLVRWGGGRTWQKTAPHRTITPVDNWFERVDEGGRKLETRFFISL